MNTRLLTLLLFPVCLPAVTRYVDASNASPAAPYTTPGTAATTIQQAVNAAQAGDRIEVAPGTYNSGSTTAAGHLLSSRLVVDKAVTVESTGGAAVTILEGSPATTPPGPFGTGPDAVRGVVLTDGAVLIGFTIRNGATFSFEQDLSLPNQCGGGVYFDGGGILRDCVVEDNVAELRGGGLFLHSGGQVEACIIRSNTAVTGGGLFLHEGGVVRNCTVEQNQVDPDYSGAGAAILASGRIEDSVLRNNTAIRPDHATFTYYETLSHGGGVYLAYGGEVLRSRISQHTTSQQGAGAYLYRGGLLQNCLLTGNTATDLAGSPYTRGNSYSAGAGVSILGTGTLLHCTVADNAANGTGRGGGVFADENATLRASIFWSNTGSDAADWHLPAAATVETLNTSDTASLPGGAAGHVAVAPAFSGAGPEPYHLSLTSPCIDTAAVNGTVQDLLGVGRPLDGDGSGTGAPDIGAFEAVRPGTDSDGDSVDDDWEIEQGLDPVTDDASLDPDGDLQDNATEYVTDTPAGIGNPMFAATGLQTDSGGWIVNVPSSSRRRYTLYRATSPGDSGWDPVPGSIAVPGNDGILPLSDASPPVGMSPLFWRVDVNLP